jgi:uridylate kinase
MRVVISLGGFFFTNAERIKEVAAVIEEIAQSKSCTVYVVTGGGELAREYIRIARDLGANETVCDYIGIDVARINAKLLIAAMHNAYPEPFSDYKQVANMTLTNDTKILIAVMGGVSPGYTTDAVAAILAEYTNADIIINATTVDGVYDVDPRTHPDAKKYDRLTPKELVAITMKAEIKAGSRIVVDPVAAKIIERSGIRTVVIDGSDPRRILDAVQGKHSGTVISY